MKQLRLVYVLGVVSMLVPVSLRAVLYGHSFFSPRSQSVNAVLDLVGWQKHINKPCEQCWYGAFAVTPEYVHNFHPEKTAQYFFGTNSLIFSGSAVPVRGDDDILADYFGLATDFQSSVVFAPHMSNVLVDFNWYCGLDAWVPGAYFRVHAPLVYARWDMELCEAVQSAGSQLYPAGYMASGAVQRSELNNSVKQAFVGSKTVGDIEPLHFGRLSGMQSATRLAEVQCVVGYNPVRAGLDHFGFNVRVSIPTGTRSKSDYFFEPVIGNGGHWEVGVGLTGHGIFWESVDKEKSFGVYSDLNLTHLFSSRQRRSFDLDGSGVLSRYMLLASMATPSVPGLTLGNPGVAAQEQYQGVLLPAINVTTLYADIDITLQADFVVKAAYCYKNLSIDLGYNLWARTAENSSCREHFPSGAYAIKGDALVYGFTDPANFAVALNATESLATIHAGQGEGNANLQNENVDNPKAAFFDAQDLYVNIMNLDAVRGSDQAILLHNCDINDLSGLSPSAITHKFFAHVSYDWPCATYVVPYCGVGASVEVDGSDKKTRSAFSQWAVWLKFGAAY